MFTFVSLVGFQPAAVATPLASWLEVKPGSIQEALLLATPRVRPIAERLKQWCQRRHQIKSEVIPISSNLEKEDANLPPAQALRAWIESQPPDTHRVLFNAEPGLNAHVVTVATSLRTGTVFLHPMADLLYTCTLTGHQEQWDAHPHADLGLQDLLLLYACQLKVTRRCSRLVKALCPPHLPPYVVLGFELAGVVFDLAFECSGYLHVLATVEHGDTRQQLLALQALPNQLNGLQPRIALLSGDRLVLERARRAGFLAINRCSKQGRERLSRWIQRQIPSPGRQKPPEATSEGRLPAQVIPLSAARGQGGQGPILAVCLGDDPSSTLVSLCSHRPSEAWVCYDTTTPTVVEIARRLRDNAVDLPVGQVHFFPTDFLGKGIGSALQRLTKGPSGTVRVDITPGTKAQGCALARLRGVEVWSLRGDAGVATCLSKPQRDDLPLGAPGVLVQARCCGGNLTDHGRDATVLQKNRGFLCLLAELAACCVREQYQSSRPATGHSSCLGISLSSLSCADGQIELRGERITVRLGDRVEHGVLPIQEQKGGYWFEFVVASALLEAGAEEIYVGVRWDWPQGAPLASKARAGKQTRVPIAEADVVARFGPRFVAASCKVGGNTSIEKASHEIEAVAQAGMGRFCVPLLVCPLVLQSEEMKTRRQARAGAVLLDLPIIAATGTLKHALEAIFRSRSTLRD